MSSAPATPVDALNHRTGPPPPALIGAIDRCPRSDKGRQSGYINGWADSGHTAAWETWTHAAERLFSAARQLDSTRIRRILRLCTPRAPARPTRARAGPDGRADSTALRSTTRALPPCAAGLMHSTRAHGAGIAAIAAIRQNPRTVTNGLMMGLSR